MLALALAGPPRRASGTAALPSQLPDSTFWRLVTTMSERGGDFRPEHLVSNETDYERVIPRLVATTPRGGVYLGVGPEQNFTYIAALQPRVAFIVDTCRQGMLQHLMYKALFEISNSRVAFVSRLFSRPVPADLGRSVGVDSLFRAFAAVPASASLRDSTLREIDDRLVRVHGFALSADDESGIASMFGSFSTIGPTITYAGDPRGARRGRWMPGFADVMMATDGAGRADSFLASAAGYRVIRALEVRNLVVPLVGGFGGPKTLRAVGDYLRRHDATVTAFYTSNVERSLFQNDTSWRRFFENVATLPTDASSTFIRAVFGGSGFGGRFGGMREETRLAPIDTVLAAYRDGRVHSYWGVIALSR